MPVTLRDVGHAWTDDAPLFSGIDHAFEPGRVCALVGPSGSGKSTLLSIIAGMQAPLSGTVEREPDERVVWVFQNPYGVAGRSTLDHVALPIVATGARRAVADEEAGTLLERFGLGHRARARFSELSGGEAQRLMLARAVAARPGVMLVDEPTAQLDRATADDVNRTIGALAAVGATVVVATHDQDTRAACDEVLDLAAYR
jgi:ABC-type lipoprotein export system ATPase subunit